MAFVTGGLDLLRMGKVERLEYSDTFDRIGVLGVQKYDCIRW